MKSKTSSSSLRTRCSKLGRGTPLYLGGILSALFSKWITIENFYSRAPQRVRYLLDSAAGGVFVNKELDDARMLTEEIALNSYHWEEPPSNDTRKSMIEKEIS